MEQAAFFHNNSSVAHTLNVIEDMGIDDNLSLIHILGKYEQVNDRYILPITIQVSHAIADGYHVALFFEKFQEELNVG